MTYLSVVIATFNSERHIEKVLKSVVSQDIPMSEMEIILIDGGSGDTTKSIGIKFGCRWIENPRTEPIYAKYLGFRHARGRFLVYLDHDEVLISRTSFSGRIRAIEDSKDIGAVVLSGYINPEDYPMINDYINEFGDPFSYFMYRLSKDIRFFIPTLKKRYSVIEERDEIIVFDLHQVTNLPLIELCAGGSLIDRAYFLESYTKELSGPELIPHLFYLSVKERSNLAVSKLDGLVHYSADSTLSYLSKIKWRIKNNIFFKERMGISGFSGRSQNSSIWNKIKIYMFIPYSLLIIPALADAIYLCVSRRKLGYLIHVVLSMYCASMILLFMALKICGYKPIIKSYDEKVKIQ